MQQETSATSSFYLNEDVMRALDDYHRKSLLMQQYLFEGNPKGFKRDDLREAVNDDLIFNVPIYDMLDRRYAAFSSFLEAINREEDAKGNDVFFPKVNMRKQNWIMLFYLFRICGSGINYKPKEFRNSEPFGTHGFGNFWIVDRIKNADFEVKSWFMVLENMKKPFTDNKGYLLPQFSFDGMDSGHLKHFILNYSYKLVDELLEFLCEFQIKYEKPCSIIQAVNHCNDWLRNEGFKRQNFVLSATMADIAEYFPELIDPNSMIFAGTNAKKCINAIFKKKPGFSTRVFESDCIRFLSDRYNAYPYSVEDSRACDPIRYFREYQSPDHIKKNKGVRYQNNSILKELWGTKDYYEWVKQL